MAEAACITEVASASAMAEDMAAMWCARYELGDVLDVPQPVRVNVTFFSTHHLRYRFRMSEERVTLRI